MLKSHPGMNREWNAVWGKLGASLALIAVLAACGPADDEERLAQKSGLRPEGAPLNLAHADTDKSHVIADGSWLSNLVLDMRMDGNANDLSGVGNHGSLFGGAVFVMGGRGGSALSLSNAAAQGIDLGNPSALQFGNKASGTSFSASAWVKVSSCGGDPVIVGNKNWNSGANLGWVVALDGCTWRWNWTALGSGRLDFKSSAVGAPPVADGAWHHIAVAHDRNGDAVFYQDGKPIGKRSIAPTAGTIDAGVATVIGSDHTRKYYAKFNGLIDEVALYRRALSLGEVQHLYSNGLLARNVQDKRRRALVIGIDGGRSDVVEVMALTKNTAPNIKALMQNGKYASCAVASSASCAVVPNPAGSWYTAAGWITTTTGATYARTRVWGNSPADGSNYYNVRQSYPTFFMRLKSLGLRTAAAGVPAFLSSPDKIGIVDYECSTDFVAMASQTSTCNLTYRNRLAITGSRDENAANWTVGLINNGDADMLMPVFDQVDAAGHSVANGFELSNPAYVSALRATDTRVGTLVSAINWGVQNRREEWLVILTADHGGSNQHGNNSPSDKVIPFVVRLFGSSTALNNLRAPVTNADTHATVMKWFGFNLPVDGKVQGLL